MLLVFFSGLKAAKLKNITGNGVVLLKAVDTFGIYSNNY